MYSSYIDVIEIFAKIVNSVCDFQKLHVKLGIWDIIFKLKFVGCFLILILKVFPMHKTKNNDISLDEVLTLRFTKRARSAS